MKKSAGVLAVCLVVGVGLLSPARAQRPPRPGEESVAAKAPEKGKGDGVPRYEPPKPEEKLVTTHHKAVIGGKEVSYTATAGTLLLKEEDGKPKASIFFVSYTKDGIQEVGKRPITFAYNGGPGSSSVWLHLGAFGPRRVVMSEEGWAPSPPYQLVDNGESLLDVTDLVFIDPVTTGYSRQVPGEDAQQFHGIKEDAEAVGEFIRLFTTRFHRWSSPKFIAGESYGTTRSARLSNYLQTRYGMYLNGVVLVSSILNFGTARFDVGNDLPYALFLPTYTATAWFHKKLPGDLQAKGLEQVVEESRRFASGPYSLALMEGYRLSPDRWKEAAAQVARFTGLSPEFVSSTNLRPEIFEFTKELRRGERLTVGRLDSRFTGRDLEASGGRGEFDPSNAAILGPFTATLNDYARGELGFESDLPYEILTGRVQPWSYAEFDNRYVNVAEELRAAMSQNPALKVFVANGYYDLATPFFATEYTFGHLGYEPDYLQRVSFHYYQAGHMMYIRRPDREQLKKDIASFIVANAGGN